MSRFDCNESARARVSAAYDATHGCELIRRKRGPAGLLRSEDAEAWAKSQPFYSRIVRRVCTAVYWCWWVRKEGV